MDRCKALLCFGLFAMIVGLVLFLVGFGTTYIFHAKLECQVYQMSQPICRELHLGLWRTCEDNNCNGDFHCAAPDDVKDYVKAAQALTTMAFIANLAAIASTAMAAWKECNMLLFVSAVITNTGAGILGLTGAAVFVAKKGDQLKNVFPDNYYYSSVDTSTAYSFNLIVFSSIISFGTAVLCAYVWWKKRQGHGEASGLLN